MKDEKFTQGEWEVRDNGYYLEIRCGYDQIGDVCSSGYAFDDGDCTKGETTRANANLISAAPDMYRALKRAEKLKDKDSMFDRVAIYEEMELALAKARGEL